MIVEQNNSLPPLTSWLRPFGEEINLMYLAKNLSHVWWIWIWLPQYQLTSVFSLSTLRDCKKLLKCHLLTYDNAEQWVLLIKPTLKAWAVGLVTAAELPDQPNGEPVISEHLLLALYSLMMKREVRPWVRANIGDWGWEDIFKLILLLKMQKPLNLKIEWPLKCWLYLLLFDK